MSLGEKARFRVKPNYAFGDKGNPSLGIPPNTELTYIIEVLSVRNLIWVTPDGTTSSLRDCHFYGVFV
jgi:hypothetical protein